MKGSRKTKSSSGKETVKGNPPGVMSELDQYLFGEGRHYQIYNKMGAHPYTYQDQSGYYFAVWAPHAASVSVVGDFNEWNEEATP